MIRIFQESYNLFLDNESVGTRKMLENNEQLNQAFQLADRRTAKKKKKRTRS